MKHLILVLDKKREDSKDNRSTGKIRCRNLIQFVRETVFLVEDDIMKREVSILFFEVRIFRRQCNLWHDQI